MATKSTKRHVSRVELVTAVVLLIVAAVGLASALAASGTRAAPPNVSHPVNARALFMTGVNLGDALRFSEAGNTMMAKRHLHSASKYTRESGYFSDAQIKVIDAAAENPNDFGLIDRAIAQMDGALTDK